MTESCKCRTCIPSPSGKQVTARWSFVWHFCKCLLLIKADCGVPMRVELSKFKDNIVKWFAVDKNILQEINSHNKPIWLRGSSGPHQWISVEDLHYKLHPVNDAHVALLVHQLHHEMQCILQPCKLCVTLIIYKSHLLVGHPLLTCATSPWTLWPLYSGYQMHDMCESSSQQAEILLWQARE